MTYGEKVATAVSGAMLANWALFAAFRGNHFTGVETVQAIITLNALGAACWYALLTQELALSARQQAAVAAQQLADGMKPCVVLERNDRNEFILKNIGRGAALNVVLLAGAKDIRHEDLSYFGAMSAGEVRVLPQGFSKRFRDQNEPTRKEREVVLAESSNRAEWSASENVIEVFAVRHKISTASLSERDLAEIHMETLRERIERVWPALEKELLLTGRLNLEN